VNIPLNVKRSGAMTILIGKENRLYYYMGELQKDASNVLTADFKSIRNLIAKKKQEVVENHTHDQTCMLINKADKQSNSCLDRDLMIIIKASKEANYKSIIDQLDEMAINGVKRYALVDIEPDENKVITAMEL
jgi:biopolymer transport protein ExbD